MRGNEVRGFVLPAKDTSEFCVADTNGFLQHGLEYRVKTAREIADDLKHLGGCRPLF